MSYFTYRLFKDVSLDRLRSKVEANLALYEPGTVGQDFEVPLAQGRGCSAMLLGTRYHEDEILTPVGFQFGGIWMDVRYQDHDSWDLSIYQGTGHRVSHDVNPWASESRVEYNQEHIDHRINRVCELWPDHADAIRRYLLPWREPVIRHGRRRYVERAGKAYETDNHGYNDADQIYDFIRAFGIDKRSPSITIGPATPP